MNHHELERMADMERAFWWHVGRLSIFRRLLQSYAPRNGRVLNIGCGTGGTLPVLQEFGQVVNVDTSEEVRRFLSEKDLATFVHVRDERLPFPDASFDIIAGLDVLEHIEQDARALKEWHRVLKPGGIILLSVPAYQWLWSQHDELLKHYRRYTASQLHALFTMSKFRVLKRTYAVMLAFPFILAFRLGQGLFNFSSSSYVRLPRPLNSFFTFLLRAEAALMRFLNLPYGASIVFVAERRKENDD